MTAPPPPSDADPTLETAATDELAIAGDVRSDALALARACAAILDGKKLEDVSIFDVRQTLQICDYFVLASGANTRQIRGACDILEKKLKDAGRPRLGVEGYQEGRWVLIDFDTVVVHVFLAENRRYYDLENLWGDSPAVSWKSGSPASA